MKNFKIKIEVSARHCHLKESDFKKLFGKSASLTPLKNLSQKGEFAAKETIGVKTKKGEFASVRIIGPLRPYTQVEVSGTDAIRLGINPPARMSGDLEESSSAQLIGPAGKINIKNGVIRANRHIHASPAQAKKLGVRNGQTVKVQVGGDRALVFDKVKVKTNDIYDLAMHIDTDEANASGVDKNNNSGRVILK